MADVGGRLAPHDVRQPTADEIRPPRTPSSDRLRRSIKNRLKLEKARKIQGFEAFLLEFISVYSEFCQQAEKASRRTSTSNTTTSPTRHCPCPPRPSVLPGSRSTPAGRTSETLR